MNDLIIKSIDKIISGDINKGIIPGDTIIVRDGKIAQIGFENEVDKSGIETVVDVDGQIVCPGFIDCHVHNTLDDYAPQRGAVGCYADALYGGTTSIVSEGRLAMTAAIRKIFVDQPAEFDPRKYLGPARDELKRLYMHKCEKVLGSAGKA